jgi:hypothetical protein
MPFIKQPILLLPGIDILSCITPKSFVADQEVFQDLDYESRLTVKDFFDSKIERSIKFMCSEMKGSKRE